MRISQECSAAGTSSDPIFILHKVTLRAAIQEPCSRVRGCRGCWREWWGCQVFGRIWCLPTPCNTHLPLGTSPPHMVWQERRHTRGWCGCQLGPIRLVVGESRDRQWRRGLGRGIWSRPPCEPWPEHCCCPSKQATIPILWLWHTLASTILSHLLANTHTQTHAQYTMCRVNVGNYDVPKLSKYLSPWHF